MDGLRTEAGGGESMSYANIVRKCSVCEGCGSCDYEYEVEYLGKISGEYSPVPHAFLFDDSYETKEAPNGQ